MRPPPWLCADVYISITQGQLPPHQPVGGGGGQETRQLLAITRTGFELLGIRSVAGLVISSAVAACVADVPVVERTPAVGIIIVDPIMLDKTVLCVTRLLETYNL